MCFPEANKAVISVYYDSSRDNVSGFDILLYEHVHLDASFLFMCVQMDIDMIK